MRVYRLEVRGSNGVDTSGTAWSPGRNLIVTAWHNVGSDGSWQSDLDPLAEYSLLVSATERLPLHPVAFDAAHDLAVLGISGRKAAGVSTCPCHIPTPESIVGKSFRIEGYAVAAPGSGHVSIDGKVMQFVRGESYPIQLVIEHSDIDNFAGLSGAPLLIDGAVVGIVCCQTSGYGLWAVPTDWLQDYVELNRARRSGLLVCGVVVAAIAALTYRIAGNPSNQLPPVQGGAENWEEVFATTVNCGGGEPLLVFDADNRPVPFGPSYVAADGHYVAIVPPERIEFPTPRNEVTWSCGNRVRQKVTSPRSFDAVAVGRNLVHASFWMYRKRSH